MAARIKKPEAPEIQGVCVLCNKEPQSHKGGGKFRALCLSCHNDRYPGVREYYRKYMAARRCDPEFKAKEKQKRIDGSYTRFKKSACEKCGFVAEHSCQLDVDHIDGNKANNDESNLQTLCANCHRLKTHLNKEFKGHYKRIRQSVTTEL